MNIGKIDNNQSFQALNFNNVCAKDRVFIKNDFKKLKELGEKYNIRLTSIYTNTFDFGVIDVDVKPLNKNVSFWQMLFPTIGRSTFHSDKMSIIDSIKSAIQDLAVKMNK